jgi:anaerobic ribonucleoside-triphosphate reductase activating protein
MPEPPDAGRPPELGAAGPASPVPHNIVQVARIVSRTDAEGPGLRTAVWVQGCTVRCPGCFNPDLWSRSGGSATTVDALVALVAGAGVEGVTLLGGEPFDQAASLARVAAGVKAAGLSVMTFTGYTWDQLQQAIQAGRDDVSALIEGTDLLVDGPFLADRLDRDRPWVGSTNQQYRALTDRYADLFGDDSAQHRDRVEIRVGTNGEVTVNGWAPLDTLDTLLAQIGPPPPALRSRHRSAEAEAASGKAETHHKQRASRDS